MSSCGLRPRTPVQPYARSVIFQSFIFMCLNQPYSKTPASPWMSNISFLDYKTINMNFTSIIRGATKYISSAPDGKTPNGLFLADPRSRDRALLVLGPNTAKQAALRALLDPSTHFRPPLTHTSHPRPALVDLSRFIAVLGVLIAVSGVSLCAFQPF